MKKRTLLLLLTLVLLVGLVLVTPVAARPEIIEFTAVEAVCSVIPGEQWVSGNVLHLRNQVENARTVSAEPLANGANTLVTNYDLNLLNGSGGLYGTFRWQPDAVNGAWEGRWSGQFKDFVWSGQAVGQGTGVLAGMMVKVWLQGTDVPADHPCLPGSAYFADLETGRILNPHK